MCPQVLKTTRLLEKETVQVSPYTGLDDQGEPQYSTPVDVLANVVRSDEFITVSDGSKIFTPLVLYIEGDAAFLPEEQDLVELASGEPGAWVIAQRTEPRGLRYSRSELDHVRLACRREE